MIVWLDHKIFGNGHGVGSPFCNQIFYWLVDMKRNRRGEFYTYWPGFGAQLHSFQWTHPRAGEERFLSGCRFRVFNSHRRWIRVSVSWAMVGVPEGIDAHHATMREFEKILGTQVTAFYPSSIKGE